MVVLQRYLDIARVQIPRVFSIVGEGVVLEKYSVSIEKK